MSGFYENGLKTGIRAGEEFIAPGDTVPDDEAYRGSWQQILLDNVGEFVVVDFLIGTQNIVAKQGILYSVGVSYIVLYDEAYNNYIVCDLYSIKFVTFYEKGVRPKGNSRK